MELLERPEYDFLRTDPRLGRHIMLLAYGGSHAYGTNVAGSDIDLRGCAANSRADLLGMGNFEQVVDGGTDTTIYGFRKLVGLLMNCNPNTIEMLGCRPEDYLILTPMGRKLVGKRKMFLSRRAIGSFGGYANQQLRRLENALAHDGYPAEVRERHILGACQNAEFTFPERFRSFSPEQLALSIADVDGVPQLVADIHMQAVPVRSFTGMVSELVEITRNYDKLRHRNKKKDDAHLNKHAMHLIRLYLMCIDILEKEEIVTYRAAEHDLLMSIRGGAFQREDHTFRSEFFDLGNELAGRLAYAERHTGLPEQPDVEQIEAFLMEVNEGVVRGEI